MEIDPVAFSPLVIFKVSLATTLRYVLGVSTVWVPGTIFFPGLPFCTSVRYTLSGIFSLLDAKNRSTPVVKTPPSKLSTLNVCASGFGLIGLSVLLSVTWVPSFALKNEGDVETIEEGFSGRRPVA